MRLGADARHPRCYVGCHATERPCVFLATDPHNVKVAVLLEASTRVRESLVVAAQRPVKGDVPSVGHVTAQYHLAALHYILVAWRRVEVEVVLLARFRHRYKVCKEDEDESRQGAAPRGARQRASHACNASVPSKDGCNLHCVRSESQAALPPYSTHARTFYSQSVAGSVHLHTGTYGRSTATTGRAGGRVLSLINSIPTQAPANHVLSVCCMFIHQGHFYYPARAVTVFRRHVTRHRIKGSGGFHLKIY